MFSCACFINFLLKSQLKIQSYNQWCWFFPWPNLAPCLPQGSPWVEGPVPGNASGAKVLQAACLSATHVTNLQTGLLALPAFSPSRPALPNGYCVSQWWLTAFWVTNGKRKTQIWLQITLNETNLQSLLDIQDLLVIIITNMCLVLLVCQWLCWGLSFHYLTQSLFQPSVILNISCKPGEKIKSCYSWLHVCIGVLWW